MASGMSAGLVIGNVVATVPGLALGPMVPLPKLVNHMRPSGPVTMLVGRALGLLMPNSFWLPLVVERPTWLTLPDSSVNQSRLSGPLVMATGEAAPVLVLNSANPVPLGLIVAIVLAPASVNQRLPSGPVVMPRGSLVAVCEMPTGRNSVIVPVAAAGRAT